MDLDDASPVVRGGVPSTERWHESLLDALDESGQAVLSVFADNAREGEDDSALMKRVATEAQIPHKKVAVTTAARIRGLGHNLEHDPSDGQPANHFHIVFCGLSQFG